MDLETAEPATDTKLSRRSLVARAGIAGFAGLAAALVVDRGALVAAAVDRPIVPSADDRELLALAIALELTVSELYTAALATVPDELTVAVGVMADNHQAYAQAISGATGLPADTSFADLLDENLSAFTGSASEFLAAAHTIEQQAVATHTSLISEYESADSIELTASISIVEARHATVLAHLLGVDDLDVLFGNAESPLDLTASGAA